MIKLAVSYTRVSSMEQGKGLSIESQEETNRLSAERYGGVVQWSFREEMSGASYETREGLTRALDLIETGQAKMFCVAYIDRSGRDVDVIRDIHRRVCLAGAQFVTPRGPVPLEADAVAMLTMEALFAEWERAKINERTSRGKAQMAQQGLLPTRSWAPMGFSAVTKHDVAAGIYPAAMIGRYVASDPEALETVGHILRRLEEGQSSRKVRDWLIRQGIPTVRGGEWSSSMICKIATNPIYCGEPVWGEFRHLRDERRVMRGKSARVVSAKPPEQHHKLLPPLNPDGSPWSPLLTRERFDALEQRFAQNKALQSGNPNYVKLLSGMLRCPRCGRVMVSGGTQRGKSSYSCLGAREKDADGKRACSTYIPEDRMIELVVSGFVWLTTQPDAIESATRVWNQQQARQGPQVDGPRIARKLAGLDKRERDVAQAMTIAVSAGGRAEAFAGQLREIAQERSALEALLRSEESAVSKGERPSVPDLARYLTTLGDQVQKALASDTLDTATKRRILSTVVDSVAVVRPEVSRSRMGSQIGAVIHLRGDHTANRKFITSPS